MEVRHIMYNAELDYINAEEQKGNTLLIYPNEKLAIGRLEMNPRKMTTIYNSGRRKAEALLTQIKEFLCSTSS